MSRSRLHVSALAVSFALASVAAAQPDVTKLTLDNGLRVTLEPADAAATTAVLLFFDIGEIHDPAGQSGLGHYIEHLFVTAATAEVPARTAEAWSAAYGGQCNAQTGRNYTLIAGVTTPGNLDAELVDLSHRLSTLRITEADLERELPRIEAELDNMYGGLPALAAMNHARAAVDPLPNGHRKGGRIEHLRPLDVATLQKRINEHYRANAARLVVVGNFGGLDVEARVRELFGSLPVGKPLPVPTPTGAAQLGQVSKHPGGAGGTGVAAAAWRAPRPSEADYPAFIAIVAHILGGPTGFNPRGVPPLTFAPLDDPTVIFSAHDAPPIGTDDDIRALTVGWIPRQLAAGAPRDGTQAKLLFGAFFRLGAMQRLNTVRNPYLTALSHGRMAQLGLEPAELERRLDALTADDIQRCLDTRFAPQRAAVAIVRPDTAGGIRR